MGAETLVLVVLAGRKAKRSEAAERRGRRRRRAAAECLDSFIRGNINSCCGLLCAVPAVLRVVCCVPMSLLL